MVVRHGGKGVVASRRKRRIYLFCPCAQLCTLEIVSPFTLYLNWQLIIYELQLWRWGLKPLEVSSLPFTRFRPGW